MIHAVDETIRALIRHEALPGSDVEVVFEAPTKDWSSRRNAPTLDVYLYDIREDLRRREVGRIDAHNAEGRITGRRRPPRHFKLSYLVTAWTQRPEDEHRLLSSVLACFIGHDKLPTDLLAGQLADLSLPVPVTIALPPPQDRALSDVWSALGGELKPSLDLVVTLPLDTEVFEPAATLVTEQPRITVTGGGTVEQSKGKRNGRSAAATGGTRRAGGEAGAGAGAAGAGAAGAGVAGAGAASEPPGSAGRRARGRGVIAETVKAGTDAAPGRVFHLRDRTEEDE